MGDIKEDKHWQFKKGQSGNLKGRTPIAQGGKPNDPHNLRAYIAESAHEVIDSMIKAGLDGDTTASNNLLKFILPQLQAVQIDTNAKALPIMKVITAIQQANEEIEAIEQADKDAAESVNDTDTVIKDNVGHNDEATE